MTDRELMQQALYVIEAWERGCDYEDYWRDRDDAITALHERLSESVAQPEQSAESVEPVEKPRCKVGGMLTPKRMCPKIIVGGELCGFTGECEHKQDTSPPANANAGKPWAGLTDDERRVVINQWDWEEGKLDYLCRLIEAKLKEKNTR